ncbi:PssE/Cps14G family polysaccharide biosynthesis glycosyltransferase [Gracilibacillus marinus]|uniref:PssE/Cps14G family polysaccharide biosynthesis glycosyltransferase n=1 Tax=Gracilibacillus marinus TaxID=630535 RepID=A0ABV8VQ13_9BACI
MILVLLGTHELPFERLLVELEKLKKRNVIEEDILVQAGNTPFESEFLKIKDFVTYEEMDELYDKASIIITHAGTGSVITGLKKGKKVIAVPRLKKYGEHNDDHQLELASVFEQNNHVLVWNDDQELESVIKAIEDFNPEPFNSKRAQLLSVLEDFIENI